MIESRTPFSTQRAVSECRYRRKRAIRDATSRDGRRQLSTENAYRVSVPMPAVGAASTTRRTARAPSAWPAVRGRPRAVAQRPLPSMMMPTWIPENALVSKGLCVIKSVRKKKGDGLSLAIAGRANESFHVIEIALERAPPGTRQPILRSRHPSLERFRAADVLGVLQLAGVDAEVAIGCLHELLQVVEAELIVHGEGAHDAKAHAFVDKTIEI